MKTWEMIKGLSENPKLKFRLINPNTSPNNIAGMNEDGNIDWYNEKTGRFDRSYYSIYNTLGWEWKLWQEPVGFMTACNSGKMMRPTVGGHDFMRLNSWLYSLQQSGNERALELINGKWEIEP